MKYWDQLEICHLSADSFEDARHKAKWSVATFHGELLFLLLFRHFLISLIEAEN
jgi:hypothetical protein